MSACLVVCCVSTVPLPQRRNVSISCTSTNFRDRLARDSISEVRGAAKVCTKNLQDAELQCLSELMMNVELLEAARPTHMDSEFEHVEMDGDGPLVVRNARFNTRVRPSKQVRTGPIGPIFRSSKLKLLMHTGPPRRHRSCWTLRTETVSWAMQSELRGSKQRSRSQGVTSAEVSSASGSSGARN